MQFADFMKEPYGFVFCYVENLIMSTAHIKNDLHRMIVETDDPDLLVQIRAIFASLLGDKDWWDTLSEEEKRKIEQGQLDLEKGHVAPYEAIKVKVKNRL